MFVCFVPLQGTVSCRGRLWLAVRQLLFSSPLMAPRSTTSTNGCVNIYIFHNQMWWACPLEEIRFQWQCQCHVFILVFIETSLMLKLLWFNFCKLYTVWLNLLTDIIHEPFIHQLIYNLKYATCHWMNFSVINQKLDSLRSVHDTAWRVETLFLSSFFSSLPCKCLESNGMQTLPVMDGFTFKVNPIL